MIDSKGLIHVPKPVRWGALLILLTALFTAVGLTVHYVLKDNPADPKFADWILVGMSLIHLTLSGLAISLVLFYSEWQVSAQTLSDKTEAFLSESVPQALSRVSASYTLRHQSSTVERLGRSDIFGAAYCLTSGEHETRVWVGLNVSRLFVIYWIRVPMDAEPAVFSRTLEKVFAFTLSGAQKVGYQTHFEPAVLTDGERVVSVWSSIDAGHNLLTDPARRLFWLQDVAMLTESFWRTALRNGIVTSRADPSPL